MSSLVLPFRLTVRDQLPCYSTWALAGEISQLGHRRGHDAVEAQGEVQIGQ